MLKICDASIDWYCKPLNKYAVERERGKTEMKISGVRKITEASRR